MTSHRFLMVSSVPVENSMADVGTISFTPDNCLNNLYYYTVNGPSWSFDGSTIGFSHVAVLWKVSAAGSKVTGERLKPGGLYSGEIEFSPVDNRYLYGYFDSNLMSSYIYAVEENATPEVMLEAKDPEDHTWLPDGKGFLYIAKAPGAITGKNIFHYDLGTKVSRQLTFYAREVLNKLSVSPSGRFIVFEKSNHLLSPCVNNLWIMDRLNPVNIWQLTNSGLAKDPEWSNDFSIDPTPVPSPLISGRDKDASNKYSIDVFITKPFSIQFFTQ